MEVTIDKFGRILIPKKLRQLLGLRPGQRLKLLADKEKGKLSFQLPANPDRVKMVLTDFGLPVIFNGEPDSKKFDSIEFIKTTRDEYLDKKMGLT